MKTKIILGSRGSKLALIQAESVAAKIARVNPTLEISIQKIVTKGDRDHRTDFAGMEGVGVFVKELEEALLAGKIDLAVHSLKDMPTETPVGLQLTAVTERDDPRDALVSRFGRLAELPSGSIIGTSSIRRRLQLAAYRPDLQIVNIRGNVDTRLEKMHRGEFDGVVLAAAAMVRLGWQDRISEYLPLEHFLPAPGQGVLAIETRSNDEEIIKFVSPVNYLPSWHSITAERTFLKALGGGCLTPIAAFATVSGDTLKLQGMVAATDGKRMLYATEDGKATQAEDIGLKLSEKLLAMGAAEFIAEVRSR